jgi:hypothetical protein
MLLSLAGTDSSAELVGVRSVSDLTAQTSPVANGVGVGSVANGVIGVGYGHNIFSDTSFKYFRFGGTLVIHSATSVTTVVLDMLLDDRIGGDGTCYLRGSAIPAT